MPDLAAMRGFFVGLLLIPLAVVTLLSIRPGGLRRQLANAARRLRLVLALAGVYLVVSGAIRIVGPNSLLEEWGLPALALMLVVVFIVMGQDPPPENAA